MGGNIGILENTMETTGIIGIMGLGLRVWARGTWGYMEDIGVYGNPGNYYYVECRSYACIEFGRHGCTLIIQCSTQSAILAQAI